MRTTLEIDEKLLYQAMQDAGTTTKRETVELALLELIRLKRRQALSQRIGNYKSFGLTLARLQKLRKQP